MFDHISSYATDFEKTQRFYDAVLEPLGYQRNFSRVDAPDAPFPGRRMCAYGPGQQPQFWIIETKTPASPRHVAFKADSKKAVDAFHRVGLLLGTDGGAPGPRPIYHSRYYGAFLIDPDGNNVEAVIHHYQDGSA